MTVIEDMWELVGERALLVNNVARRGITRVNDKASLQMGRKINSKKEWRLTQFNSLREEAS